MDRNDSTRTRSSRPLSPCHHTHSAHSTRNHFNLHYWPILVLPAPLGQEKIIALRYLFAKVFYCGFAYVNVICHLNQFNYKLIHSLTSCTLLGRALEGKKCTRVSQKFSETINILLTILGGEKIKKWTLRASIPLPLRCERSMLPFAPRALTKKWKKI